MKRKWFLACGVALLIFATGCVRNDDLTMVSSKNVLLGLDKSQSHGVKGGSSPRWIFLMIPFGLPSLAEATDNALNAGNGNLMLNAVVYDKMVWYIPLILGRQSYLVEGEVYQVNSTLHYPATVESTESITRHKTEPEGR